MAKEVKLNIVEGFRAIQVEPPESRNKAQTIASTKKWKHLTCVPDMAMRHKLEMLLAS